jgi:hypothetical protein
MRFRFLQDGSIVFPNKGQGAPDKEIPFYRRDPNDPFHYIPDLPSCNFKQTKVVGLRSCGLPILRDTCCKGYEVSLETCCFCTERIENEKVIIDCNGIGSGT